MAFCTKCGQSMAEDAVFCGKCGTKAGKSAPPSEAGSVSQCTTILALDTPTLLQVIRSANSVIIPYAEAVENYQHLVHLQQWCIDYIEDQFIKAEAYGWSESELDEYNNKKQVLTKGFIKKGLVGKYASMNRLNFAKKAISENLVQQEIVEAKSKLEKAEENLLACQSVSFIPPAYRYPLALSEVQSYLENFRAENWKEAVNLYEEQLHRWQMEADSEDALALQQQAAILAGEAASSAATAALFSGVGFIFKR